MSANVRFLLFPSGKEFCKIFPVTSTFKEVKSSLFQEWPTNLQVLSCLEDLRLIHSGRIIEDEQTVKDVFKIREEDPNPSVTVHIAIKRSQPVHTEPTPVPAPTHSEEEDLHFHLCSVDEEEVSMLSAVFNKKKGRDSKIAFAEVERFIKTYWQWMKRNNYKGSNESFPDSELQRLKTKILGTADRLTDDQFRQFFYLFDNPCGNEATCPHGEKMRVKLATQILHQSIKPNSEFATEVFDNVFSAIDRDADGVLSCRELELLYYMYSTHMMNETEAQ